MVFSKLKKMFSVTEAKSQDSSVKSVADEKVSVVTSPETNEGGVIQHARELELAFVSNLLGVRALENDDTQDQEQRLRDALDGEMAGMTEQSIPKLSAKLLELLNDLMDDETPQSKIIESVEADPALAGKVLSIANSPLYIAADIVIKDLEHAVSMLGHKKLREVLLASVVSDSFKIESEYFKSFGHSLWEHSAEVAVNARTLATKYGGNTSLSYFVGLIHDIGKLVIFMQLVELHSRERIEPHPLVFSRLLNDYSDALTRRACEVWQLPEYWYQPIMEFQMADGAELELPESKALTLANTLAELHTLFSAGEITEFELVWRLQESGSDMGQYQELYPDPQI